MNNNDDNLYLAIQESLGNVDFEKMMEMAIQESMKSYEEEKIKKLNMYDQNIIDDEIEEDIIDIPEEDDEIILNNNDDSFDVKLFLTGYKLLNKYQKDIFRECINRKSFGLSLPLGSGKTLLSLVLTLYYTRHTDQPILIVVGKSLLDSWTSEIKKFFGDDLKYEILHSSNIKSNLKIWKPYLDTKIILTTIDTISKFYNECNVSDKFVRQVFQNREGGVFTDIYNVPIKPLLNHTCGMGWIYSVKFGAVVVDEVQKYTNIQTNMCKSLGALCAENRCGLSGTMFDEPKYTRILGYYIILNYPDKPRDLPELIKYIDSPNFKGLNETLVLREKNRAFVPPKINEHIISHDMNKNEELIYMLMRKILLEIKVKAEQAKVYEDAEAAKKLNGSKMTVLLYLRQAVLCPIIPLASISINASDIKKKSELSGIIMREIRGIGVFDWLNNENSARSSRIAHLIEHAKNRENDKIIIFCSFKTFTNLLKYYMEKELNRPIFMMSSHMSFKTRGDLINEFENSGNGIFITTYQLAAEGLNLQFATTVFIADFWWNAAKTKQAIGRIFRFGQTAEEIYIYFFTSNTSVEKILYLKQDAKETMLKELETGKFTTKVPKINMNDIIKLIELEENVKYLQQIEYYNPDYAQ